MSLLNRLRIFLTASVLISGCGDKKLNLPYKEPDLVILQPIIEQEFCDSENRCVIKSMCCEYKLNKKLDLQMVECHELKKCHGTLGVEANKYQELREWSRKTYNWMQEKCNFEPTN